MPTPISCHPAERGLRGSALSRHLAVAYVLLVIYASLHPFSGWHDIGVGMWDYLDAPLPRYITAFDVISNILAYLPLGFLAVLALAPPLRAWIALPLVTAGAGILSALLEGL